MFQTSVPNPVFHLKAIVILSIPIFVVLIGVTSVDLLFTLTVQLTIAEINELHWILDIGRGEIVLSQETSFLRSGSKYSLLLDSFLPLVHFFSLALSCK